MTEKDLHALLESMSLKEKLGELWQPMNRAFDENGVLTGNEVKLDKNAEKLRLCGSTLNLFGFDRLRRVQDEHIKNHPHHIPMLFMGDIIHGFGTVFPQPLAMSCSFDPDLVRKAYRAIAAEASASGINVTYFPMMDLVRDPRWGRVMESGGEDPYLCSRLCAAIVQGLQGDGLDKKHTMASCVKHFAAYGGAEGGRDYNSVEVSERSLRQYYLPGYKGGIDAGARMVMTSYNTIGGIPSTGNKWLFRTLLREEWGFDGVVITDLYAMSSMYGGHGIGNTAREAAERSMEAGIDIEMGGGMYEQLESSVQEGRIDERLIDEAVWRCLKLKNDLGLFENPYRWLDEQEAKALYACDEHLTLAKRLATESCVLLKNAGDCLPLDESAGHIAFIGPFVEHAGTRSTWDLISNGADREDTLKNALLKQYPHSHLVFARGCAPLGREQARESARFGHSDEENREKTITEAVELAKTVDTVVLALGELPEQSGEAKSRANIRVPDVQLELYRRVRAVSKRVIVLVYTGRPLDLTAIQDADAILVTWHLGTMENAAIADLLFGRAAPTGRLTMAFPRSVGQIPVYYNHLPTDHRVEPYWSEYIDDCSSEPLYPFGYGLTYSSFTYSAPTLSAAHMRPEETITAAVTIRNDGARDACETVQLYIRDVKAAVSRPVLELKGFQRVFVPAGETVRAEFSIEDTMLRYYHPDMTYTADAGEFEVYIAPSSAVDRNKKAVFRLDEQ